MARLISEREVRAAARTGTSLNAGPHDIITPAARDLANQLGVPLRPIPSAATATPPSTADDAARPVIAMGADHGGFRLKESLKDVVTGLGFSVLDLGCNGPDPVDYPVFAARVAREVAGRNAYLGIVVDGAGIGSAMVANKTPGVRAASCHDVTSATNARAHNNANVLTLGAGLVGERLAADIVRTFLVTGFEGGRHARRVAMIDAMDQP